MNAAHTTTNTIRDAADCDVAVHGAQALRPFYPSVRRTIGDAAWERLPAAVRKRFADNVAATDYEGVFDIVHANFAGKLLAIVCRLINSPIAPHTGCRVPATVRVFADDRGGSVWERTYRFAPDRISVVRTTKQLDDHGGFVEALPAGLRMPLDVFERDGILHFVSREYFFKWFGARIRVPDFLPPGVTHVEHIDEGGGWFRFTMTVTHKWFGTVFFQTGRFRAAGEAL